MKKAFITLASAKLAIMASALIYASCLTPAGNKPVKASEPFYVDVEGDSISIETAAIIVKANFLPRHDCGIDQCPYTGLKNWEQRHDCEPGTDCDILDMIHFAKPDWSYEECEEYLFGKPGRFTKGEGRDL